MSKRFIIEVCIGIAVVVVGFVVVQVYKPTSLAPQPTSSLSEATATPTTSQASAVQDFSTPAAIGGPSITIVSPQGGVLDNGGSACTGKQCGPMSGGLAIILWNEKNGNYPVTIYLLDQAGNVVKTIAQNATNTFSDNLAGVGHYTGEFIWSSDASLSDGTYMLEVAVTDNGREITSAKSNYFTITNSKN